MQAAKATIDFETRSTVSLRASGAWRYALDESTDVLCLAYRLPYWDDGVTGLWHPAFPLVGLTKREDDTFNELMVWIWTGELVEAHNAFFERCIWTHHAPRWGWPDITHDQWRCSAAKASSHALPRGLDDALAALTLPIRKDADGGKVMMKMNKPRKPRKAERDAWETRHPDDPHPTLYYEDRHLLEQLFAYCRQDVLAECALSDALPDLSPAETAVYLCDQTINVRGFQLDPEAVYLALALIEQEERRLNGELAALTGGKVQRATQRARLLSWLEDEGCVLKDTTRETISWALTQPSVAF